MAGLNGVQIFVGDTFFGDLVPCDLETTDNPHLNEYEFYKKNGDKHYFRNIYRSLIVESDEMPKMKYGTKVVIEIH